MRTKGTSLPYSYEEATDEQIDSIFAKEGGKGREMVQKIIAESDLATKKDLEDQNMWMEYNEEEQDLKVGKGPKQ